MDRWRFTLPFFAVLLWLAPLSAQAVVKPNVIVFLADDMGIGDASPYLGKKLEASQPAIDRTVRTANLDRLAQMGTTFTSAYAPSSMCSTSRYAMLTGRYAWRSNTPSAVTLSTWTSPQMIDPDRPTLANVFRNAGYDTAMFGKWHMGVTVANLNGNPLVTSGISTVNDFNNARWPTAQNPNIPTILSGPRQTGFDYWYGTVSSTDAIPGNIRGYFENETLQGVPVWTNPSGGASMPVVPSFDISKTGETVANKALDMIDSHAGVGGPASNKPLFMYYASLDNHSVQSPPASISLQGTTYPIFDKARMTNGNNPNVREDTVYQNDIVLGAMLDKLQNTIDPQTGGPMIDNTLIIFSSDNGADTTFNVASGGLRGHKQEIYEAGVRVPFIASWAGQIPQGATSDQLFGLNDLYATLSSVVGHNLTPNEAEDSQNVLPALTGQTTAQFQRPGNLIVHDNSYGANDIPAGAVLAIRSGKYKLIVTRDLVAAPDYPAPNAGQSIPLALYDLSADWHEDNNLLNNPAFATTIAQMQQKVLQYHNQGFSRTTIQTSNGPVLQTDGGADLANNINGSVGYEFTVGDQPVLLTRLGMWDDGAGDVANQETNFPNPDGDTVGTPDGVQASHWVRLFDKTTGTQLAGVEITSANSTLDGEFRYVTLNASLKLNPGEKYALTMSTAAADGDLFHMPESFTGDSPISTSYLLDFQARRGADGSYPALLPNGVLPTGAASESVYQYRFFVGPTASLTGFVPLVQAADFNFDGKVDGADFLVWQRGLGTPNAVRGDGDADGNGLVNGADLLIWKQALASVPAGVGNAHGVPEPATLVIALAALAGFSRLRRDFNGCAGRGVGRP